MKKLFALMIMSCCVAVPAQAYDWTAPQTIQHRGTYSTGRSDYGNIAVENGKVGFADVSKGSGTYNDRVTYNEFTYSGNGNLTKSITGEELSPNLIGAYGVKVLGISFNSAGQPVVGSAAESTSVTGARVSTRQAGGAWPYTQASGAGPDKAWWKHFAKREAFQLDSADKAYFVYTDTTGGSGQDIVVATSPDSTYAKELWTQTILSTPAYPLPNGGSGYSTGAKLALDASGTPYAGYLSRNASTPPGPGFQVGVGGVETATGMFQDTERSHCDIEIQTNGYPMVASLDDLLGGVTVSFFDGVSYSTSLVVSIADEAGVIEHNLGDTIDLEVDGQGRPVVLVATTDDALSIDIASLDMYTLIGASWVHENVLTVDNPGATDSIRYPDLVFDENGRPFISFSARYIDGEDQRDAYIITQITQAPQPATMLLLLVGALGMGIIIKLRALRRPSRTRSLFPGN